MFEKVKSKRTLLFIQVRFLILIMLWLYFVRWLFWYKPIHIDIAIGENLAFVASIILSFIWFPLAIWYFRIFGTNRKFLIIFLVLMLASLATILTPYVGIDGCYPMYEPIANTIFHIRTNYSFCYYSLF
jgi:hypothetical protein